MESRAFQGGRSVRDGEGRRERENTPAPSISLPALRARVSGGGFDRRPAHRNHRQMPGTAAKTKPGGSPALPSPPLLA